MLYYSFDIGGTSIKHALVSFDGLVVRKFPEIKSGKVMTDKILKEIILEEIENQKTSYDIGGICISSTGVVDPQKKQVVFSGPTLPDYGRTNVFETIEKNVGIPLTVENDVNCAILGEYWRGNLIGTENAFMIALGTGVGGAMLLNGELYRGVKFSAGEIGYMNLDFNHFQNGASAKSFVESVSQRKKQRLDGYGVISLIKEKDPLTMEAMKNFVESLTYGIMDVMYLLNPEKIILGGGIMEEFEVLYPKIEGELKRRIVDDYFFQTVIEPAHLGNDAGIIGAVYHHLKQQKKDKGVQI